MASQLEQEVRRSMGEGNYKITIHNSPLLGWHAIIHTDCRADLQRLQAEADRVAAVLSESFRLAD